MLSRNSCTAYRGMSIDLPGIQPAPAVVFGFGIAVERLLKREIRPNMGIIATQRM